MEAVQLHQQGAIAGWLTVEDGGLPGDGAVSGEDQRLVARRGGEYPRGWACAGWYSAVAALQHIECPRMGEAVMRSRRASCSSRQRPMARGAGGLDQGLTVADGIIMARAWFRLRALSCEGRWPPAGG